MYGQRKPPRKPIYDSESGEPPTERQIERMKRQADNVAQYWLEQKRMTVHEMRQKLEKKKLIPEIIDEQIKKLLKVKNLDDDLYIEDFIYYRQETLSSRKMREQMLRKGLDEEAVDEALLTVDEGYQRDGALKAALRRARATAKEQVPYKRRSKIVTAIVSRGYPFDLAASVADEAILKVPPVEVYIPENERSDEFQAEKLRTAAFDLAEAKARGNKRVTDAVKRKQSIIQSLLRKGYGFELAREAAEHALGNE